MCSTADNNHENKFKSYDIKFHELDLKTIVTSDPTIVDQWISETYDIHKNKLDQNKILVGLDTEWSLLENPLVISPSAPNLNQISIKWLFSNFSLITTAASYSSLSTRRRSLPLSRAFSKIQTQRSQASESNKTRKSF